MICSLLGNICHEKCELFCQIQIFTLHCLRESVTLSLRNAISLWNNSYRSISKGVKF